MVSWLQLQQQLEAKSKRGARVHTVEDLLEEADKLAIEAKKCMSDGAKKKSKTKLDLNDL